MPPRSQSTLLAVGPRLFSLSEREFSPLCTRARQCPKRANPFAAASPRDSTLKKRKLLVHEGSEPLILLLGEVKRFTAVGVTQG
jgi:hypothetical protein